MLLHAEDLSIFKLLTGLIVVIVVSEQSSLKFPIETIRKNNSFNDFLFLFIGTNLKTI